MSNDSNTTPEGVPEEARDDQAERPGTTEDQQNDGAVQSDDELADEWGEESFPSSDPPAHY
ncbi:hypothetical protein GCM10009847_11390 [Leucobacter tardus]|uniref:Uncharacterized protein n=1 Tax=Leucobacter tardus TaxID=501483 RepID=A0A939QKE5_9MICO|nr:hypothetical protein [Leucobacter tardus]MBO2989334.1 hypothetical protein [Leucobacter tardus]